MTEKRTRPPLCPCSKTCTPLVNALALDDRMTAGDLNEGYSGDCIGKMAEGITYIVGGQEHPNDLNHCIFTPLKGIVRFMINQGDIEALRMMCESVLAKIDPLDCEDCGAGRRMTHFIIKSDGRRLCCRCDRKTRTLGDEYSMEWWIVFSVMVSGKKSKRAEKLTNKLVDNSSWLNTDRIPIFPLTVLRELIKENRLAERLRELRTGQYDRIEKALTLLVYFIGKGKLDLFNCTAQELEEIPGIGPKTARFFLLRTRSDVRHAALDTHILKWLRSRGYDVPKSTPQSGKRYAEIEKIFLDECDKADKTPAVMDMEIWKSYAEPRERSQHGVSETSGED